jgi:hypothetical protein
MHSVTQATRRHAVHLALGLGLALIPTYGSANSADAGDTSPRFKPAISQDGHIFDINLSGDAVIEEIVSGPTLTIVTVPANASTDLLGRDLGFGQFGYDLTFQASDQLAMPDQGPALTIAVYIPATSDVPVSVNIAPRTASGYTCNRTPTSAEGTTNSWITVINS